jgi:hypothetical protein
MLVTRSVIEILQISVLDNAANVTRKNHYFLMSLARASPHGTKLAHFIKNYNKENRILYKQSATACHEMQKINFVAEKYHKFLPRNAKK